MAKDSTQFREVTEALATFFDNNPRRIKQFVNVFRLRAHIAHSTGLFNDPGREGKSILSIPQLGKFTALAMLFPQFIEQLATNPVLLHTKLQVGSAYPEKDNFAWRVEDILFLTSKNEQDNAYYDMHGIDVISLLQTMPPLRHEPQPAITQTEAANNADESDGSVIQQQVNPEVQPPPTGTTTTTLYPDPDPQNFNPAQESRSEEQEPFTT